MGKTLKRKYRIAVADRNIQMEGHRRLTATLEKEVVGNMHSMGAEGLPQKKAKTYMRLTLLVGNFISV